MQTTERSRRLAGIVASALLLIALAVTIVHAQGVTLSGTATQGTGMSGASVTAYAVNPTDGSNGTMLESTTADSGGDFLIALSGAPNGPVRILATGGSVVSPSNGVTIATPSNISLLLADVTSNESGLSINPLTSFVDSLAVGRLTHTSADLAAALITATAVIERFYALKSDPATILPNYATAALGTPRGYLALVLGALATEDQYLCPSQTGGLVAALATDIGDAHFDGQSFGIPVSYCGGSLSTLPGISEFQDALSGLNQLQLVTSAFIFGGTGNLLAANPGYRPSMAFYATNGINSGVTLAAPPSVNQFAPSAKQTRLLTARYADTATVLRNGQVLLVGGWGTLARVSSNEFYDPLTNSSLSGPSTNSPHSSGVAALLPDGKVLIAGGDDPGYENNTDIYDPSTNSFAVGPLLTNPRNTSMLVTLADGRILIAGGFGSESTTTTDIYDPATNTIVAGPSMTTARTDATATLLPTGKVLIAGGDGPLSSTDIYDPITNSFSAGPSMNVSRKYATATLLPNGKVLIAGGQTSDGHNSSDTATVDIYDTASNTFFGSTPSMNLARETATATLLPNGKVMIAGGGNNVTGLTGPIELYDPVSNTFAISTPSLNIPRVLATVTLLLNGRVLIAGGYLEPQDFATASRELYVP